MKKEGSKPFKTLMPYVQSVHDSLGDVVIEGLWERIIHLAYVVFVTFYSWLLQNQCQTLGHLIIVSAFVVAEFGFLMYWLSELLRHTSGTILRNGGIYSYIMLWPAGLCACFTRICT